MRTSSAADVGNRQEFRKDERAYMDKWEMTEAQKQALLDRDYNRAIDEGGNVYFLAKFTGIFGLGVQDIGAQQTGMSVDEFRARLRAAGS